MQVAAWGCLDPVVLLLSCIRPENAGNETAQQCRLLGCPCREISLHDQILCLTSVDVPLDKTSLSEPFRCTTLAKQRCSPLVTQDLPGLSEDVPSLNLKLQARGSQRTT